MLKPPMVTTPYGVASLALGLVAASFAVLISELTMTFVGWPQIVGIVVCTGIFAGLMRAAFARAEGKSLLVAGVWSWLAGGVGTAICSALLGVVISVLDHLYAIREIAEITVAGGVAGLFLGMLVIPIFLALRAACMRPLVDVFDRVLVASAALVTVANGFVVAVQMRLVGGYGSIIILGIGTVMFVLAGVKTWTRARWLHAVIRGEVPNWNAIAPFDGDDQLPAIGVRRKQPAVLATGNFSGGPFRAGGAVSPVARIDRAGGYNVLAYVAFACALATVGAVPFAIWQRQAVREHTAFERVIDKPLHFENVGPLDDLTVGSDAVCARLTNGSYKCWGSEAGWLAPGKWKALRSPAPAYASGAKLALGAERGCTLQAIPGPAQCARQPEWTPVPTGPESVRSVAFGDSFELFLADDGTVLRRGTNVLGYPSETTLEVPPVQAVAARGQLECLLTRGDEVYCAGQTSSSSLQPLHAVVGFGDHKVDRITVREGDAWGRVTSPDGQYQWFAWNQESAVLQPEWTGVEEIAADSSDVCGRRMDGSVICARGVTAVVNVDRRGSPATTPVEMLPPGSAVQLAAGPRTVCARGKTDVWCWDGL